MAVGATWRRIVPMLLLVSATLAAGCAGSDDPPPTDGVDPTDEAEHASPFAEPAEWTLGQWWRYSTASPEEAGEDMDLAVTAVDRDAYTLDTASRDTAGFHAEEEISFIGPIRVADLAGRQGNDVVEFFRFPLEEEKEWTTSWDGVQLTVKVVSVTESTVELVAEQDGAIVVEYSYSADAGFFGHMIFNDPPGQESFRIQLKESGENYTDPLVRATVEVLWSGGDDAGAGSSNGPFGVPEETEELVIRYSVDCSNATAGEWQFSAVPTESAAPQDESFTVEGRCPDAAEEETVLAPPSAGTWWADASAVGVPPDAVGHYSMDVLARNFEEIPAPT